MKIYKGRLSSDIEKLIKENKALIESFVNTGMGRPNSKVYTIEESVEKYNPGISKDEIRAWVWYRKSKGIPMASWKSYFVDITAKVKKQWLEKGIIFHDPVANELVPFPVFVFGNIYTKIGLLKKDADSIIAKYGTSVYDNHIAILEKNKPNPFINFFKLCRTDCRNSINRETKFADKPICCVLPNKI